MYESLRCIDIFLKCFKSRQKYNSPSEIFIYNEIIYDVVSKSETPDNKMRYF